MQLIKLNTGNRTIDVEVYAPVLQNGQQTEGILLLHEMMGLLDYYREDAQDLANKGYLVYVPNLYTDGATKYCIQAMVKVAGMKNKSSSPLNQEIHALMDTLKADTRCNGRLGILGACMTGGFVLHMAQRDDVHAPVVYHHGLGIEGAGVPHEETDNLKKIPVIQGHFANVDIFCPAKKRKALKNVLGERLEDYYYNMPHGFRSTARSMSGSKVAWQRTVDFFDEHLRYQQSV